MSMLEWAKREIEIASAKERSDKPKDEWDYRCACYASALKAFESLLSDNHSGYSIGFTKNILNRLIDGKPLTPIEDTDDMWNYIGHSDNGANLYQCKRMTDLFKHVYADGSVKYKQNDRILVKCIDSDTLWHNGFVSAIYNSMYPITMPYIPNDKPDIFVCEELLTESKNGDYDTLALLYINRSNGEKIEVNRYFKETEKTWVEISSDEYEERQKMHNERIASLLRN